MSDESTSPFVLVRARVAAVERVSPSFARITFAGAGLGDFGTAGATFDQRIKLIFPNAAGRLPDLGDGEDWWDRWLALPEDERGAIRTYSIRDLQVGAVGTRVVVDFVLHVAPGQLGPAAAWAEAAATGDELLLLGPRRGRVDGGGIEFAPGDATWLGLAGDETAAPAIARILEDLPRDAVGTAFIEVPTSADALPIDAPVGVEVVWLPRDGAHGTRLVAEVLRRLDGNGVESPEIRDVDSEELLWETAVYSGLGEDVAADPTNHADRYYWIAGESGVVTTLRRHLVRDFALDRSQVAFMGYWRIGVAMRG
jgi:NADPH-dependent ferric siderophore reductase